MVYLSDTPSWYVKLSFATKFLKFWAFSFSPDVLISDRQKAACIAVWKSSVSRKTHMTILIQPMPRCTRWYHQNYMLTWISPIRHIIQTSQNNGFYAICPHINIKICCLNSLTHCKCSTTPYFLQQALLRAKSTIFVWVSILQVQIMWENTA